VLCWRLLLAARSRSNPNAGEGIAWSLTPSNAASNWCYFWVTSGLTNQADATGNVADERMEQGDLRGALELYQEQLQLAGQLQLLDAPSSGLSALVGYNVALIREFQGNLARAKLGLERSLAIFQKDKSSHSFSGYAMWSLGKLLLAELLRGSIVRPFEFCRPPSAVALVPSRTGAYPNKTLPNLVSASIIFFHSIYFYPQGRLAYTTCISANRIRVGNL